MTSRLLRVPAAAAATLGLFALGAYAAPAHADWTTLNMTPGVTELSREIYALHMRIFWVCVWIGVVVFGIMIFSIIRFRKSTGAVADTNLTHNTPIEVAWTVLPIGILIAMAVPAARVLLDVEDMRNTELTIKVTAYQWKWQYQYLDSNVSFFSTLASDSNNARQLQSGIDPRSVDHYLLNVDNYVVVPENTKVRLLLTAQDVIHAWWVPALGMKRDAIPGSINELWFKVDTGKTGVYRGQCAELCGRDHGFMPIVVDVRTKADYQAWVKAKEAEQKPAAAPEPLAAPPATAQHAPAGAGDAAS
jgi:cytochrome c oxidase subunit 2